MYQNIRRKVSRFFTNFPGWRTDRKIVVIESDDWGSIRMPSKEVYEKCLKSGYRVDNIAYERFDSLASEDDLELLFDLLSKYRDKNGNPAVITANALAANPDFKKIEADSFHKYYYELITETFKRYPKHSRCYKLWNNGLEQGVFYPQSHGREHLNVSQFMNALQNGDEDVHFGFRHKMPGCIPRGESGKGNKYVSALNYNSESDKKDKLTIVAEGLDLFEKLFGYRSKSFIPPNYKWSPDFDKLISQKGVQFYQGNRKMIEPTCDGTFKINKHNLGEENKFGQKYLVRNAIFEPAMLDYRGDNQVAKCLSDINIAFKMKKPAIICSHRLNYIGFIDESNRDRNLKLLKDLLDKITKKWPEIEFMTSVELGKLIDKKF